MTKHFLPTSRFSVILICLLMMKEKTSKNRLTCSRKEGRDKDFQIRRSSFAGPGGLAWGATHADIGNPEYKIVHAWANDYDENTCKTYRRNICPDVPSSVYHADVRKFDLTKLSPIDAFAFGFPCNDYSVVGEQKGMDGVYGPLYSYGVKVLKLYQPQWFLAKT